MKTTHHHTDLLSRFEKHIETNQLFSKKDHLFLACSGGIDSVVLVHLLHQLNHHVTILHCNFQLRGKESVRDQQFVVSLAASLNIECIHTSFDTKAAMHNLKAGVQETARKLRYDWFNEVIAKKESDKEKNYLLTAHQLDDQLETVAFNFLRGTGIAGLHGMKAKEGKLIRPLLFATRQEILEYAKYHKLTWVEDSSNQESDYSRNHFRHQVFPSIEKIIPTYQQNLANNIKRLGEVELLYEQQIASIKKKIIEKIGNAFAIPVNKLKALQPLDTIVYELFVEFGFHSTQIDEIKKLLSSATGSYIQSSTHRVLKNRAWLLIESMNEKSSGVYIIESNDAEVVFGNRSLEVFKKQGNQPNKLSEEAWLDADLVQFPLVLRPWKKGDYFYPLGMKKKKKISKFLIDLKCSLSEKEQQYVVESNNKILWVVGKRIDERFKVTATTSQMIKLALK